MYLKLTLTKKELSVDSTADIEESSALLIAIHNVIKGYEYTLTDKDRQDIAAIVDVKSAIDEHNTDETSHVDIRTLFNSRSGLPVYDAVNYRMSFESGNGAKVVIDLPIEQIGMNYDPDTKEMWFINASSEVVRIDLTDFLDIYLGSIGEQIQMSVSSGNVITATLLSESIKKDNLTIALQAELDGKVNAQGGNASNVMSTGHDEAISEFPEDDAQITLNSWFGILKKRVFSKLDGDGDASNVAAWQDEEAGPEGFKVYDYGENAENTPWTLAKWLGVIRARIHRLDNCSTRILTVTASRASIYSDWVFGSFSSLEFESVANAAINGAPIKIHFLGTTNNIQDVDIYPDALWNAKLAQIECRELSRAFYMREEGSETFPDTRGCYSFDTPKYQDLGALLNTATGNYEYIGLTDIVESECRESYYLSAGMRYNASVNFRDYAAKTRFLFPIASATATSLANAFWKTSGIQRVRLCARQKEPDGITNLFLASPIMGDAFTKSSVVYVEGGINISLITSAANLVAFTNTNMQHILLYGLKVNLNLASSSNFDIACILYMIQYRANGTTNITITLQAAAYARALASTSIQTALQGSYINLASA